MCQTSDFGFILNWLTTIATLFLAIAACYNIMELKDSRKLSLRPHLIILPPISTYIFFWIPLRDLAPITRASKESENIITRLPVFRIKNIGFAVAKSIEIKWEIHLPDNITDLLSFITGSVILRKYSPHMEDGLLTFTSLNRESNRGYPFSLSISEKKNIVPQIQKMITPLRCTFHSKLCSQ